MASTLSILKTVLNLNGMHVTNCETVSVSVNRYGDTYQQTRIHVHEKLSDASDQFLDSEPEVKGNSRRRFTLAGFSDGCYNAWLRRLRKVQICS